MTKISAWPGTDRSGATLTRPPLPAGTPSHRATGEASTPAHQMTFAASMRLPFATTPSLSIASIGVSSSTSTPIRSSERRAKTASFSGKPDSTRGPASTSRMCAVCGLMWRKSRDNVAWASSASAPAISTPVGPAPTRTKVSKRWRIAGSVTLSASSKASSTRRRINVASSIDLRPGASRGQSSWPK